jgi:hypothetical protein
MKHATTTAMMKQTSWSAALPRVSDDLLGRGQLAATSGTNPVHGFAKQIRHDSVWCDVPTRVSTPATTYGFGAPSYFAPTRFARGLIGS